MAHLNEASVVTCQGEAERHFWPQIKKMAIRLVIISLVFWFPGLSASAQASCNGCNVVDEGRYSSSLVGRTVHHRKDNKTTKCIAVAIDTRDQTITCRLSNGNMAWGYAVNFYTPEKSAQRDENIAWGWLAAVAAAAAAAAGSSSGKSSHNENPRSHDRYECEQQCRRNTNYNSNQSTALGADCLKRCQRAY